MKILDNETFENFISSEDKVVVDFFADWCGPCKAMMPLLESASTEQPEKVAKLNVDQSPEIAAQFGIRSIPTMLVFQAGKMISKKVGAPSTSQEILDLLN